MLLSKREEQMVKAFLDYGKLSIHHLSDLLGVSQRTVYRSLSDLEQTLTSLGISLYKQENRYFLTGDLSLLDNLSSQETYSPLQRLQVMTYHLVVGEQEWRNEDFQELFLVSNVTVIQDIAQIERRLVDFDLVLERKKGYQLRRQGADCRRFLAVLLTNAIGQTDFAQHRLGAFDGFWAEAKLVAQQVFEDQLVDFPQMDIRLQQFFVILLALAGWQEPVPASKQVSRLALDLSQKIFASYAQKRSTFYNIQEILYFASILDELVIKRQENPLFNESFDSEFYYNVSNLIDKVSQYTKINFVKDKVLFGFLFHHIRMNLAVPIIFTDETSSRLTHLALDKNEHLHRVVSLLLQDIFPKYLQSAHEYDLITLHFASSLRRSPDIYPIRICLLTDERPLTTELLATRIKSVAPFVEEVVAKSINLYQEEDWQHYHTVLATKPVADDRVKLISSYPEAKELLTLQDYLQEVQANQEVIFDRTIQDRLVAERSTYLEAAQDLLQRFELLSLVNPTSFAGTVVDLVDQLSDVANRQHLADKLLKGFDLSPLAIPGTNLALLHTQSQEVLASAFKVVELTHPVEALSMTRQLEKISRFLVMVTAVTASQAERELMTAISQSLIENNLYTEIYRTGNQDIIYQLLNYIFTEKLKKLEN